MLELNERYSDVTLRMLVIRCAKGDVPTANTLWQGASSNGSETRSSLDFSNGHLSGISIKYMLELNKRYSDVTFRMLVI